MDESVTFRQSASIISTMALWSPLMALQKKDSNSYRPIAVGETLRRLVSRLCCNAVRSKLPETFLPYNQVGVGIKGGLEAAIHTTRYLINHFRDVDNMCILKVDFRNAFNECQRQRFLTRIATQFPELFGWVQYCYYQPAELRFGSHRILSSTGVQQGDPLGPLLFSLVLNDCLDAIDQFPSISQIWYLEDGAIVGTRSEVSNMLHQFNEISPQYGLYLNINKCEIYWPSGDALFPEFPLDVIRLKEGVCLLGSPLWGSEEFFQQNVNKTVDDALDIQLKTLEMEDPQVELHLLRSCLGICKINHLLRTVPKDVIYDQLLKFDIGLRSTFLQIIHTSIPDHAWLQVSLPFRLGGLGIREAVRSSSAAFIASVNQSKQLAHVLLDNSSSIENVDHLLFYGEEVSKATLSDLLVDFGEDISLNSQHNIQVTLDQSLFNELLSNIDLYGKTRLRTLSSSNDTSAWLRAPPISSLGLSIHPNEFVIALRIWLGIHCFPSSPLSLCFCGSVIDHNGDHLLGWGHNPLRIRRHESLCDIVYHSLHQDGPLVRREQRLSGAS